MAGLLVASAQVKVELAMLEGVSNQNLVSLYLDKAADKLVWYPFERRGRIGGLATFCQELHAGSRVADQLRAVGRKRLRQVGLLQETYKATGFCQVGLESELREQFRTKRPCLLELDN